MRNIIQMCLYVLSDQNPRFGDFSLCFAYVVKQKRQKDQTEVGFLSLSRYSPKELTVIYHPTLIIGYWCKTFCNTVMQTVAMSAIIYLSTNSKTSNTENFCLLQI